MDEHRDLFWQNRMATGFSRLAEFIKLEKYGQMPPARKPLSFVE